MQNSHAIDEEFMQLALLQARRARKLGDVPVGAVVVNNGLVIAQACNRTFAQMDPCGHAEIAALQQAARLQQSPRLTECTLYVTLEPCCMCVGAMVHARIDRLVFAAHEPKTGAVESAFELAGSPLHNHQFDVTAGVLAEQSRQLLRAFFASRRDRHAKRFQPEPKLTDD